MINQKHLRISFSDTLDTLVKEKSKKLGIPATQYVKYLVIKDIDEDQRYFPSKKLLKTIAKAEKNKSNAVEISNMKKYLDNL